jgi:actin-like ATPase involved in cell morphogenesis
VAYDLGVDLGTTYTCAARASDGRIELVQLGHTSPLVPSVVSLREDGEFVVGDAAERRSVTDPARTVREFKRRLGDEAPYVIGGAPFGAELLAAELLGNVVHQVEATEGAPARRVALAHPANYGPFKLGKLRDAAARAGVTDPLLVPEPVAAALAYAQREGVTEGQHVLVYDLGGGTFDVAVVRLSTGGPEVVGTPDGLERLGGIDFDAAVLNHVDRALDGRVHAADADNPETRAALARLRDECRGAKEALSSDTETQIPVLLPDLHENVRLTRAELEQILQPRLEDTFPIVERVVASAGIGMGDVATILTVGGSSRIPLVAQLLRERTQRPVTIDPNPKSSVAIGAAAVAAHDSVPAAVVAQDEQPAPDATMPVPVAAHDDEATVVAPVVATESVVDADTDSEPHRRRKLLVAAIAALVVLGGAGAAFALGGGGSDDGAAKAGTSTGKRRPDRATTTTTTTTSTTLPAGFAFPPAGASGATGGAPAGGTGRTTGGVGGGGGTSSATQAPVTTTTLPRPTIQAQASTFVTCGPGDTSTTVEVYWGATNATSVDVGPYTGQLETQGSLSGDVDCTTDSPTSYVVTARGPGGSASTTVHWSIQHS